jgi:hypothetical protein
MSKELIEAVKALRDKCTDTENQWHNGYDRGVTDALALIEQHAAPNAEVVEAVAAAFWRRDYPNGGFIYKRYENTPFHDKELYRKEALEALTANQKGTAHDAA